VSAPKSLSFRNTTLESAKYCSKSNQKSKFKFVFSDLNFIDNFPSWFGGHYNQVWFKSQWVHPSVDKHAMLADMAFNVGWVI
jgi:hypothetical protein